MRSWKHVLGIAGIALALGMAGAGREPVVAGCLQRQTPINIAMFHGDRARLGWNAAETELSPAHVSGPAFGPIWSSPPLDSVTLDGRTYPPRLYATPLYVDGLAPTRGPHAGAHLGIVFAASSSGWVYAISASASRCAGGGGAPGTILWRTRLAEPAIAPGLDGGVPIGVLSTPVIDLTTRPARLYVTAMDVHAAYLAVDGRETRTTLVNPGSPVVTSNGGRDAIVWVLDPRQRRTAPLVGPDGSVARPVLHAFDAFTLERLWRGAPGDLEVGGKYSSPTVGRGMAIVGTDRIQAFGLRASR